jgi:hypothetical protein
MSDQLNSDSEIDSDSSYQSSSETPKKLVENRTVNEKKRQLHISSSTDSPSPPVQNLKSKKLIRTEDLRSNNMDEATKKFFEEVVKASEERTGNLIKNEISTVKKDLSRKVNALESEVANLKLELGRANTEIRKRNIMIEGIAEKSGETWNDAELLDKDLIIKLRLPEKVDFDECFRIGKPGGGKVRPILLKMLRIRDKRMILSHAKNLKGSKIYINEDLTKEQRIANAILRKNKKP